MDSPRPFNQIRVVETDGTLADWWFEGDGDQETDEHVAAEYLREYPDCKFVRLTFTCTGIEPYDPEPYDPEEE